MGLEPIPPAWKAGVLAIKHQWRKIGRRWIRTNPYALKELNLFTYQLGRSHCHVSTSKTRSSLSMPLEKQ